MNQPDLQEFGRRYAEAWCSQDPDLVAGFFSERGSLSVNDGPPAVGRQAIAEVARGFMTDFPDMVVTMDALEPRSRGAIFHWTLTGTNTGPGGTGNRVRIGGFEDWRFGPDDLVSESEGHFDRAEYDDQLQHGVQE